MLIVPASNVSVPLTVVKLIRSRVPTNVTLPPDNEIPIDTVDTNIPVNTHVSLDIFVIVTFPCKLDELLGLSFITNPEVCVIPLGVVLNVLQYELYPDVIIEIDVPTLIK